MHPHLAAVAAAQGQVFTASQALAIGYTRDEIRARLASGRWHRERRGIFREAEATDVYGAAVAAAVLACRRSGAVASHRSAAHVLELPLIDTPRQVELTVAETAVTSTVKGCVVHRASLHAATQERPIPVTTPARTVIDFARTTDFVDAVVVADHLLATHPGVAGDLSAAAARLPRCHGHRRIDRVLAFASARSGSVGESVARVVMAEHGLPPPLLGELVVHDGELLGVVDFLWPELHTVVEFDGRLKYRPDNDRGEDRLWREKLREDRLRDAGYEVVRVTWEDARQHGAELAGRVRAAFARAAERRAPRLAGP